MFGAAFTGGLYAGSTGTTALHMPQGGAAGTANGDYVADAAALNTFYRYFIEVPSGISKLQIELFDADIGAGGGTEDTAGRDRTRNGDGVTFSTTANYTLLDPSGTTRTTRFNTGSTTLPAGGDNAWLDFYNATGNTVLDQFGTNAYNNNNGTSNWSTDWTETDAGGGGATGGSLRVTGGELRLQDVNAGTQSIYREADLLGTPGLNMGMAFLTFSYRTSNTLEATDTVTLEVSNNGGTSWTTLETFADDSTGNRSYDVTSFIANNTRFRFTVSGGYTAADEFFFVDDFQVSDGPITAGHWELRIDQTAGGIDINALGIRAHDGNSTSGGTELNVYADSMVSLGVNPPASGTSTRNYTLYPWITSGCTCSQNDFDLDTNNGNTGSVAYTSRGTTFTQSFASAALSANNVWNHDNITGWTSDTTSGDYGIWTMADSISTYTNANGINGNYETKYVANYLQLATDPTVNPITSGGNPAAFRIYLPTDAGGAPAKPYLQQAVTRAGGPGPALAVGVPTTFTVTITMENPAAQAITFNASNLITSNVPGGGVVYAGSPIVSQGAIVSAPAIGGTGNVTWNPGSLSAGGVALLAYNVTVTATSAGQRLPVTATPASGNGTRAQYIDETGNATQTRARYTAGPICELAVTQGLVTEAVVSKFDLDVRGGATTIQWSTSSEAGTVGFNVYRANGERVNRTLIPASLKASGGKYELVDNGNVDPNATYIIEELTASREGRRYGPFNHLEGIDRDKKPRRFEMQSNANFNAGVETNAKEKIVAAMVGVRSTGIVRLTFADLANALRVTTADIEKAAGKGGIAITDRGSPIAWTSDGANVLFFGEKTTSIYSNDRVYRVELSNSAGVTMATVPVKGVPAALSTFPVAQDLESDVFAATVLPLDASSDYWYWEALISGDPTYGRKTFNVNVPAMASASNATMSVRLQGAYKDTTHRAKITLNGVPIGEASWFSFDDKLAVFNLPAGVLRDGANTIDVEGVLQGDASFDIFYVDGFTIGYDRFARPDAGQLEMHRTGSVAAGPFDTAPMILDITSRTRPAVLQGAAFANGMASLNTPSATRDLFFAQSFVAPSFVRASAEQKLKGNNLGADWIIVAPRGFRTAAEQLATMRSREGLTTYVADLDQIYDEFAGGNTTPIAIRDFFKYTRNWTRSPKYFVLAGTGTVDYRGIEVAPGPLPPLMTSTPDGLYASDSLFVDRNSDRLPDVAIGRIPVSTPSELSAYVAKLDANARISASSSSLVFSADAVDQGADFRRDSQKAEAPFATRPVTRAYVDDLGGDGARTTLMNAWHSGTALVSWVGHGGLDQISSAGVLSSYDAPDLTSEGRLPVLVAMTCTINRFENGYVDPMGTALTKQSGAGAVAVWSASGLSTHSEANEIQRTFMRLAGQTPGARVGDLVVRSLAAHASDTASIYLLLGDPAIKLDLPAEVRNGGGPSLGLE
ncbi:MAG TPA: C25 family cysteine peptidase [Thermoanaerobaculia bacterium]|nr:C25 family cysteine peptidase [Thermoanaerobaculia bacterium]